MDYDYVLEELDEWQLIRSLSNSSINAQWISENELVINDDFFSDYAVFTPIYHQSLSMYTSLEGQLEASSSEQPIYSRLTEEDENESNTNKSDEDGVENEDRKKRGVVFVDEWKSRLVVFVSKAKKANWWFSGFVMTGVMSMLVASLWCMKVRKWRKRVHKERVEQLMLLRERDQKINELLLQIAQMNEVVSSRRNVPVIRVV